MSSINTGTGGINVDGKAYTFDVSADNKAIEPVPYDKGDINVSDKREDVSDATKKTLAYYMNLKTSTNRYPVNPDVTESSLTTQKGVPAPQTHSNSHNFVDPNALKPPVDAPPPVTVARMREKITDPAASLGIAKGKVYPSAPNGHDALRSVKKDDAGLLNEYTSVVLSNNRFSNAARAVTTDVSEPAHDYDSHHLHPRLGDVTDSRLAQVGVALTLRASQEMGSTNAGNNPTSGLQEAKALLPGINQLGASRVNTRVLEARDVLSNLTQDGIPSVDLVSSAPGGSWGALNNVFDPFSGLDAIGMVALATALTAATVVTFDGLSSLLSMIKGGGAGPAASHDDNGRYLLGRYTVQQDTRQSDSLFSVQFPPDIGAMLGIRPTVHPFSTALQTGVAAFFRVKTSGDILGQLTSTIDSSTDSPGFNVVVARSIIRSSLNVIDSFKTALKSKNIVSGIKNVIGVVDAIKSSKFMSALNVFAALGDAILIDELKKETVGTGDGGRPEEPTKRSRIDKLSDDAGAISKNRLRDSEGKISLKLAWSSNRAPAMYLLPAPTAVFQALAGGRMGAPQGGVGLQDPASKTYYSVLNMGTIQSAGARIPYDSPNPGDLTVSSLERYLEGDYMPFYFHDLRTNEIVSFHAFLTALSDDYTPNWESTDAYGRVDPVRVYKNTSRKVQLGFHIVSTSDEDFNDMWTKINKLVTLVYPQYTQGRVVSDDQGKNKFVQPFSQLIGASPLVRVRLGDLLKSNYSRFALARLFGADSNAMTLDGKDVKFDVNASAVSDMQAKLADEIKNPVGKTFVVAETNLPQPSASGLSLSLPMPRLPLVGNSDGSAPSNAPVFNVSPADMPFFRFTVTSKTSGGACVGVVKLLDAAQVSELYGYSSQAAKEKLHYLSSEYDNSSKPVKRVVGGAYVVPTKFLRNSPESVKTAFNAAFSSEIASVDSIVKFLSPDSNSLVKSFSSTAGKGLAGTIDNLSFNWYEGVLWETSPGKKAPQMCQVSISFTPIHDVSPGIDWMGANRAPVYPVAFDAQTQDLTK